MHDNPKVKRLLNTARGQIEGVLKMIETDRDCLEISSQLLATQSILKKVNIEILRGHLSHCVKESFEHDSEVIKQEKMEEFVLLLNKIIK